MKLCKQQPPGKKANAKAGKKHKMQPVRPAACCGRRAARQSRRAPGGGRAGGGRAEPREAAEGHSASAAGQPRPARSARWPARGPVQRSVPTNCVVRARGQCARKQRGKAIARVPKRSATSARAGVLRGRLRLPASHAPHYGPTGSSAAQRLPLTRAPPRCLLAAGWQPCDQGTNAHERCGP